MLWWLVVLLVIAWAGGFGLHVGDAIHFLLVIALILALYNLFFAARRTVQ